MPYARGDNSSNLSSYGRRGDSRPKRGRSGGTAPVLVQGLRDIIGNIPSPIDAYRQGVANYGARYADSTAARSGSTPRVASVDANGNPVFRKPQMNPANIHALRRAMRRLERAEKLYSKIFTFRHGPTHKHVTVRPHHKKGK